MKRFGRLLLVASSLLSVCVFAGCNTTKNTNEFNYSSNLGRDCIGKKNAVVTESDPNGKFTNDGEALLSPTAAQVTDEYEVDDVKYKSLRIVSALHFDDDATEEILERVLSSDDYELGFHIAYNDVDRYVKVENIYRSISAGDKIYRGAGQANDGDLTMADWVEAMGDIYKCNSSDENDQYNYFIALEIEDIPEASYDTIITAQPYCMVYGEGGKNYAYGSTYRKMRVNSSNQIYDISVTSNGVTSLTSLTANDENGTQADGTLKDEYVIKNLSLNKGDSVSIVDAYGQTIGTFETNSKASYEAPRDGSYNFYYKTANNKTGNKQLCTYISEPNPVYSVYVDDVQLDATTLETTSGNNANLQITLEDGQKISVEKDGDKLTFGTGSDTISSAAYGSGTYEVYVNSKDQVYLANKTGYLIKVNDEWTSVTFDENPGSNNAKFALTLQENDIVKLYKNGSRLTSGNLDSNNVFKALTAGDHTFFINSSDAIYVTCPTVTYTIDMTGYSWFNSESAAVYAWCSGNDYQSDKWIECTGEKGGTSLSFAGAAGYSKVTLARFNASWGTSNYPTWTQSGSDNGRLIWNKSNDITISNFTGKISSTSEC